MDFYEEGVIYIRENSILTDDVINLFQPKNLGFL